jgi:propanediol dehydratase-reactivating factor small subunit
VTVIALLADEGVAAEIRAGFEEEGVPLTLEFAAGDAIELARAAARRSPLGLGVGCDTSRLVLVLAAASGHAYLETPTAEARAFGHSVARVASRRPLALLDGGRS